MLMNDKIIFDRYYCINSAETKKKRCRNERNMVHYILQPHHIFIRVKAFVFMLVPGGLVCACAKWKVAKIKAEAHFGETKKRILHASETFIVYNSRVFT